MTWSFWLGIGIIIGFLLFPLLKWLLKDYLISSTIFEKKEEDKRRLKIE